MCDMLDKAKFKVLTLVMVKMLTMVFSVLTPRGHAGGYQDSKTLVTIYKSSRGNNPDDHNRQDLSLQNIQKWI